MPRADSESDAHEVGVQADKWMRWMIAIAVMAAAVMELVDTSAVNVSLPYIAGNLSASVDEATWVLTSYLVANAIILPLSGWLANYFGRRRLLMMSVDGLHGASILCGLGADATRCWFSFECCKARRAALCSPRRARSCWRHFPARSAGTPWHSGASAS